MASLSIGIVGLPNVGKSTLFNLITKQSAHVANYPFATIDPNVGVVPVPDARLSALAALSNSKRVVPAVVEFYDIAGLVKGANEGEGLGNKFLSHIREVNAIVHLVRCFPGEDIIHVEARVDPLRDVEIIHTELILKDVETLDKRAEKLEKEARADKAKERALDCVRALRARLGSGLLARGAPDEILGEPEVRELNLLTVKPQLYLLNGEAEDAPQALIDKIASLGSAQIAVNLATADALDELIAKAYEELGLMSFFTTGEDETRAWTIVRGSKAPQASGVIHTDFEQKFIRAEVIACGDLIACGSWSAARAKGMIRVEGKEYVMRDGDVIVVRHG